MIKLHTLTLCIHELKNSYIYIYIYALHFTWLHHVTFFI